ncbi:hypothetical protein N9948_00050 [bacterium]|nr:hypothetical protein [bacterium]
MAFEIIPKDDLFKITLRPQLKKDLVKQRISVEEFIDTLKEGKQIMQDNKLGLVDIVKGNIKVMLNKKNKKFITAIKNNSFKGMSVEDHKKFFKELYDRAIPKDEGKRRFKVKKSPKEEITEEPKKELYVNKSPDNKKKKKKDTKKSPLKKIELRDERSQNRRDISEHLRDEAMKEHKTNSPVRLIKTHRLASIISKVIKRLKNN